MIKGVTTTDTIEYHYIYNTVVLIVIMIREASIDCLFYIKTDNLGLILRLIRPDGSYAERYFYDAWGRRRNPTDWTYENVPASTLIDRGYTGHEHYDLFGLIDMNGRVYDPVPGRFLSPDPIIQFPYFTQSFNSYGYCFYTFCQLIDN